MRWRAHVPPTESAGSAGDQDVSAKPHCACRDVIGQALVAFGAPKAFGGKRLACRRFQPMLRRSACPALGFGLGEALGFGSLALGLVVKSLAVKEFGQLAVNFWLMGM